MSATIIKILNSGTSGSPSALATGELAYSYLAGTLSNGGDRLYIGTGTETNGEAANIEVIGGKYFTEMLDHTKGALKANSAIVVDGNSKIDVLNVDNITLNGNTITTTDVNGNLILDPNGTGLVQVSSNLDVTGDLSVAGALNLSSNVSIEGTLTVDGITDFNSQVTAASLNVEDLTTGRVVYSGVDGELIDSDQLKFNGTALVVGYDSIGLTNRLVINAGTGDLTTVGNVAIGGTINVDGQSTFASLNVEDLTATRVVFAGASGELVDSADFAFISGTSTLNLTGQLNVDNLRFDGNTISATNANGNIVIQPIGNGIIDLSSTQAVRIPVGTLAERPSGLSGEIRFNTTDGRFEGFDGTAWAGLGGVVDVDQDTYIKAETSPGADNDDLEFYTAGTKRVNLDQDGMLFVDTALWLQVGNVKVEGNTISTTNANGTLYLDPNPVGSAGTVVIEGNLQVNGTTTTVNSTEMTVQDPVLVLGGEEIPTTDDNRDRGIAFNYHDGSAAKLGFFGWDDSAGRFKFISDATENTSVFTGAASAVEFGNALLDSVTFSSTNYTNNGVMYANTSGDVVFAASSTEGHVLQINASGVPVFGIIDCGTY